MSINLLEINNRRRQWKPNNPAANSETSTASNTISRCLSLTNLEPAVAYFINSGLDKQDCSKLSPELIQQLRINVTDEDNHEIALTQCKAAMVDYNSSYDIVGEQICNSWKDLKDNPITIAAVLELSVFFCILPIYSLAGGGSLRQTSQSISGDERLHTILHRDASMKLGCRPSSQLNKLRLDTVAWLFQDISEVGEKWSVDRMIKNSNSLLQRGVSDMVETQIANINAPFELSNRNLEAYS